jgi:hypothetical protein
MSPLEDPACTVNNKVIADVGPALGYMPRPDVIHKLSRIIQSLRIACGNGVVNGALPIPEKRKERHAQAS